jgi:hypothetical protein
MRLIHAVALPAVLEAVGWNGAIVMRVAPDEVLAIATEFPELRDPHAIVEFDDGYAGIWLSEAEAQDFLSRSCEWAPPTERPAFAQGAVAGLPAKLWFEQKRVLILVPAPYAMDLEERLR